MALVLFQVYSSCQFVQQNTPDFKVERKVLKSQSQPQCIRNNGIVPISDKDARPALKEWTDA